MLYESIKSLESNMAKLVVFSNLLLNRKLSYSSKKWSKNFRREARKFRVWNDHFANNSVRFHHFLLVDTQLLEIILLRTKKI